MDFEILNASATDRVALGETRREVRKRFGEFVEVPQWGSDRTHDHFESVYLIVGYSCDSRVDFLDFASPSRVSFKGIQLLEREFSELTVECVAAGERLVRNPENEAYAQISNSGVGLFLDGDDGETVKAVSLGDG